MKVVNTPDSIDVQSIRIGMFVHLDLGWMSHPFPLSSFKVTNAEQIATIRSLGLKRVRWSPHQSALSLDGLEGVDSLPSQIADFIDEPQVAPASAAPPPLSPEQQARAEHRRQLAEQRAALTLCDRQFSEAALDCKELTDLIPHAPQQARGRAEALSRALLDKMLAEREVCIRLLTDAAGDKSAMHALNVAIISLLMGRSFNLPLSEMIDLGMGAMLHDIGKIELPDRVRHREEHFTTAEVRFYEEHVSHGVQHARRMGLSPGASLVVAQHHEHADGTGFPLKINTDRMTSASRIVSLVNRYDNLCNPHSPGKALTPHEALSLLFAQGKTKFDTAILGAFIKMMGVYPPGSTVQLTDDRFAMVVAVNSSRPLKPRVLVHDANVPRDEALVIDLENVPGLGIRRSMRPQQLPRNALEYLSPRTRVAYFFEPAQPLSLAA